MKLDDLWTTMRDAATTRRVYGEPVERDGVTFIPAAAVRGGGGGGSGHKPEGEDGEGGGFAVQARPVGGFVIRDGRVRWRAALDVQQLVMWLSAVAVVVTWLRRRRPSETGS